MSGHFLMESRESVLIRKSGMPNPVLMASVMFLSIFLSFIPAMNGRIQNPEGFHPDEKGFIRHWLYTGPAASYYHGRGGNEEQLREEVIDRSVSFPGILSGLYEHGLSDTSWKYFQPGRSIFLDLSEGTGKLSRFEAYGVTELVVDRDMRIPCKLWTANTVDLWLDRRHICSYTRTTRKTPSPLPLSLNLKKGRNQILVRLQELAARDTPFLVGLQILENKDAFAVSLPVETMIISQLKEADEWFESLLVTNHRSVSAARVPAFPVSVSLENDRLRRYLPPARSRIDWPDGSATFQWVEPGVVSLEINAEISGQNFHRTLEIPQNILLSPPQENSLVEHQRRLTGLNSLRRGSPGQMDKAILHGILARFLLNQPDPVSDEIALQNSLSFIDQRIDCADFSLAVLLRLYCLGWGSPEQRGRMKQTILNFRYWKDEAGTDAMAFGSENHMLLFHSCQYIAGTLFPQDLFTASGRKGTEQAGIGGKRCLDWLQKKEVVGFDEFLSTNYLPVTVGALMNLVDFSENQEIVRSASGAMDAIFSHFAEHSFDGVTAAPQGRVYRSTIYPHMSRAQGMISFACLEAVEGMLYEYATFLASSAKYKIPESLNNLMYQPINKVYHQSDARIHLKKTANYMLSSIEIPSQSTYKDQILGLKHGDRGYQQHVWHASLGRDCHIFVNHPGSSYDGAPSRPGYWYGNGILPKITQRDSVILEIFNISDTHHIDFTHAYWPSDIFDRMEKRGQWVFGSKNGGYIALWCSHPLYYVDDILTGRELRADGRRVAWICVCSGKDDSPDFEFFIRSCLDMSPAFDADSLALSITGQESLKW